MLCCRCSSWLLSASLTLHTDTAALWRPAQAAGPGWFFWSRAPSPLSAVIWKCLHCLVVVSPRHSYLYTTHTMLLTAYLKNKLWTIEITSQIVFQCSSFHHHMTSSAERFSAASQGFRGFYSGLKLFKKNNSGRQNLTTWLLIIYWEYLQLLSYIKFLFEDLLTWD